MLRASACRSEVGDGQGKGYGKLHPPGAVVDFLRNLRRSYPVDLLGYRL